jgi:poly(A) polymerase
MFNKDRFGELVDPFGGLTILQNFVIRTPLSPELLSPTTRCA